MPSELPSSPDALWLERVVETFNQGRLEAILVGNAAAAVHGAPVTTQDLDFYVRGTDLVRRRVRSVARQLGGVVIQPSKVSDTLRIEGNFPDIDILFYIGPFKFESVRRRSARLLSDEGRVYLTPLDLIIASKEHFRRDKDLAVLPVLKKTLAVLQAMEDEGRRR